MSKKAKDNDTNKRLIYYNNFNDEGIKKSIVINANQMIDLNGKIDTFSLIDKALIDSTPILNITDNEGNKLNTDRDINYWLNEIDNYTNYLNDLLNADISNTTADDLTQLATDFNYNFLVKYVNGISLSATDLIGRRENYADYLARALVDLQALEILKIGISKFSKLDLNNTDASFKQYMQIDTLKRVQDSLRDVKNSTDANTIKTLLYQLQILDSLKQVDSIINNNKKYYEDLHKKYENIDNLIGKVGLKYKAREDVLNKYANAVAPKQAKDKQINLHLAKLFNNTYPLNKYTSIDKSHNEKYDIQIQVSYDDDFKDLRNIIFVDDINKKQISLLPIDLALFIGFTSINNINGGNIPITLTDAFRFISEDKKIRIRKGQKANQLYDDKMQLFKSFKVSSIIKDRDTNKTLIEFKDAIPILENYKVDIKSRNDKGYIIGASAILSILNFLSDKEGVDYLTTFSTANSYINDNQNNTIETLNMKYYIIIKVLQMNNAKNRGIQYNPHINLDDLYNQTAQLKGVSELSRDDKKRLRQKLEIYLNHLKGNSLLMQYDYKPLNASSKKDNKLIKSSNDAKNDIYIKI